MNKFQLPAGTTNRHQWHKNAMHAIKELDRLRFERLQKSGVTGVDESEYIISTMFSGTENQKAEDLFCEIGDQFDWMITKDNADQVIEAVKGALPVAREAMPIDDNRETPEQRTDRQAEIAEQNREREAEQADKSRQVSAKADELRALYPWAIGLDAGMSSHARAAKNMKKELKQAYPHIKFSVTSDSFSMGNSISVSWTDGAPASEIKKITDKYQYGSFNGMDDIYENDNSAYSTAVSTVLGQSKYVIESRTISESVKTLVGQDICLSYGVEYENNARIGGQWLSDAVYQALSGVDISGNYKGVSLETGSYVAEFEAAPVVAAPAVARSSSLIQAHIEEHTHTKKGFVMYMVVPDTRLDRDTFNEVRNDAKAAGGWYSRKWGSTPGGFAFEDKERAESFLASLSGESPNDEPPKPRKGMGEKFRAMADKMQPVIDNKLADRPTNTAKRLAQANHSRLEGEKLQRTQQALLGLADMHDAGTVPAVLANITSKKAVFDLMGTVKTNIPNGYHSYSVCTGEPHHTTPEAVALWSLITGKTEEQKQAEELKRTIDGLQFSKIPGYFPTPKAVIDLMIDYADIQPHHRILEPNLGSCSIADAVAPLCSEVKGFEINHTLAEIADAKDYLIEKRDFLTVKWEEITTYDRVLMNPPFENLQDVDHVMRAYKQLSDTGRLVAIMSPSPFFRSDKKCEAFRAWFDNLGGEKIELPEGSFKESGTGINTVLVVIDK